MTSEGELSNEGKGKMWRRVRDEYNAVKEGVVRKGTQERKRQDYRKLEEEVDAKERDKNLRNGKNKETRERKEKGKRQEHQRERFCNSEEDEAKDRGTRRKRLTQNEGREKTYEMRQIKRRREEKDAGISEGEKENLTQNELNPENQPSAANRETHRGKRLP